MVFIKVLVLFMLSYFVAYLATMLLYYIDLNVQNPDIFDDEKIQQIKRVHLKMNPVMIVVVFLIMLSMYFT